MEARKIIHNSGFSKTGVRIEYLKGRGRRYKYSNLEGVDILRDLVILCHMPNKGRKIPGWMPIEDAAADAGVSRMTLYRWLEKLHIVPARNAAYLSDEDVQRIKDAREGSPST